MRERTWRWILALATLGFAGCGCPCDLDETVDRLAGDRAVDCGGVLMGRCFSDAARAGRGAYAHIAEASGTAYVVQRAGQTWIVRAPNGASTPCGGLRVERCADDGWVYEGGVGCTFDRFVLESDCPAD